MKTRTIVFSVLFTLILGGGASFFLYAVRSNTKACPLPNYSSYHGYPQDLLILKGRCVVPTAIDAIQDRTLSKRRNIIDFLGNGPHEEALVFLVKIVEDDTEPVLDRASAIIAVFQIDNERGRGLAQKYETEESYLGKCSRDILANKSYLYDRKSYWAAWRSYIAITYAI